MRRLLRRVAARLNAVVQSDTAFVEAAYREILGREADQDGLNHYRRALREGLGRTAVLLELMRSEEFTSTLTRTSSPLPSLRVMRPERYSTAVDRTNGQTIGVFDAADSSDFDWLEAAILRHRYYEQPGVWNFGIDVDKRVLAEMVASFAPERALEVGCAAGAVLECLGELGIAADGIEISAMALAHASERIRPRILQGDLLAVDLTGTYDAAFGFDVFEHLNPNRLDDYLHKLVLATRPGAYLLCNVPAFGPDPVFGTVFPFYLDGWERDAAQGKPFSRLQVDDLGYPLHGHLIWADTRWWVQRFEGQGLRREVEIEEALHRKYDAYMDKRSRARKAYYVFSKDAGVQQNREVIERIARTPSKALA